MHDRYTHIIYEIVICCVGEEYACTVRGQGALKPLRISLADTEVENVKVI